MATSIKPSDFALLLSSRAIITDFYLIDAVSNLFVYIPTVLFCMFLFYSINTSRHFSKRPKLILLFDVFNSLIVAVQSLSMTIHYLFLYLFDIEVTIQSCSIAQNYFQNPIIYSSFVIPLDRYLFVAYDYEMPFWSIMFCQLVILGVGYATSTYNSFFAMTIAKNTEVCQPIRRNETVIKYALLMQLCCFILTLLFFYLTSRKLQGMLKQIQHTTITKSPDFYRDMKFLKYYCGFTFVPMILCMPALGLWFIKQKTGYFNKYLWVTAWSILHSSVPLNWMLGILALRPLRRTASDGYHRLFCRRWQTNTIEILVNSDAQLTTNRDST